MYDLRRETQLVSVEFARLEELIQERALVALAVAVAGNEAGDSPFILHCQLHEFAFFEEAVHTRICPRGFRFLRRSGRRTLWASRILPRDPAWQNSNRNCQDQYEDENQFAHNVHQPLNNRTTHRTKAGPGRIARKIVLFPLETGNLRPPDYHKPVCCIYHRKMSELATLSETSQIPPPQLLVELPSRPQVFFGNLRDLLFPHSLPQLELRSAPAPFWHDVFVKRGLPWFGFLESFAYHVIAFTILFSLSRFLALHPDPAPRATFDHSQIIYYEPSEYLPPIDTRSSAAAQPAKADSEYARQPIISVPPEADNRSQTIVAPPNVKLKRDLAMPNIVAWSNTPQKPRLDIPPAPLTMAAELNRLAPTMENSVVAPPPDAAHLTHRTAQPNLQTAVVAPPPDLLKPRASAAIAAPEPAVVAPPPVIDSASTRQLGELNIAHSSVIAPAPQLPVAEQRAVAAGRPSVGMAPQVVPPPPSVAGSASGGGQTGSPGRVIVLGLHPAVGAPPVAPQGNRRGAFAATPEGHAGASGSPGSASSAGGVGRGNGTGNGTGANQKGKSDLPAGLYVGSPAPGATTSPVAGNTSGNKASSADPPLAHAAAPRASIAPAHVVAPENATRLSEPERAVFGIRKFYALTVNMPNLNSSGGSWIIRFAELNQDAPTPTGSVTEPVATRKVDPGYPTQLIRENVAGTVILYGVIHADGAVGNIRVLRGVDDRLDRFASNAVEQWHFQPATKDGSPIDVEATFHIPFHPPRPGSF